MAQGLAKGLGQAVRIRVSVAFNRGTGEGCVRGKTVSEYSL